MYVPIGWSTSALLHVEFGNWPPEQDGKIDRLRCQLISSYPYNYSFKVGYRYIAGTTYTIEFYIYTVRQVMKGTINTIGINSDNSRTYTFALTPAVTNYTDEDMYRVIDMYDRIHTDMLGMYTIPYMQNYHVPYWYHLLDYTTNQTFSRTAILCHIPYGYASSIFGYLCVGTSDSSSLARCTYDLIKDIKYNISETFTNPKIGFIKSDSIISVYVYAAETIAGVSEASGGARFAILGTSTERSNTNEYFKVNIYQDLDITESDMDKVIDVVDPST